ncbi:Ubiquitin carboxyl-terminal hydrolase 25 [Babesia microti strain RI]|uniref:Ubiquitin carboxyl-terminal hydrolase 25 n=1 Tax=Babesia microti (strain RI) TaxID=1133968 RepID=I7JCJ9_BABMR|nr:Ubiquitin carboxyl-terminal hydrolase 25 [Babesia microti strain RI]CCF75250.1 Ubiquitin carboxyl-terminal hydrolase 25 [Babesia microti strain RI]|eukprot:XP_012649658.1 Ubiquitin carboxyl-terminal hydrolase 25 [Babesia microti strain RI]
MQPKMDHSWHSYADAIKSSTRLPDGIENVDFPIAYNHDPYLIDSHVIKPIGSPVESFKGIVTGNYDPRSPIPNLPMSSPDIYNNYNYKSIVNPVSTNKYENNINRISSHHDQSYERPIFGRTFNEKVWGKEFDSLQPENMTNLLKTSKDKTEQVDPNDSFTTASLTSMIGGDTLQRWKIPESKMPITPTDTIIPIENAAKHLGEVKDADNDNMSSTSNYRDVQDVDTNGFTTNVSISRFSLDKSGCMNHRNNEIRNNSSSGCTDTTISFKWNFLMNESSESEKLEAFKQLVSVSSESEIPSIISYLIQLISMRNCHRAFAIRALTFTLASHPEIVTSSFQLEYVEKLFIHPSVDDLGASFLRLLLNNMANIQHSDDESNGYAETAKSYIWKVLQICCDRAGCNNIELLRSSRLRDWVCTFWYEMPFSIQDIDIGQICLSWINNRHDAMYLKDGPFALLARERDSRGQLGVLWLFENFIQFVFKHSSNLSIDFQYVIRMCGVDHQSKNEQNSTVSYIECLSAYFKNYKGGMKGIIRDGIDELDNENTVTNVYYSHILDVWIALSCIPWPPRHPNTPHLQLLSHFFQFIILESNTPIAQSLQLSLIRASICISISRIAAPINAEDAALQVITLMLHGNRPFIHEQVAPRVLSGVMNFIRRRLFLWHSVDSGISRQTIQTVQTLYDIINQVVTASDINEIDNNDMDALFLSKQQHKPLFPRANIYNHDANEANEDISNDIIDYVSSNRETSVDGANRLKFFLSPPMDSPTSEYKNESSVNVDLAYIANRQNHVDLNSLDNTFLNGQGQSVSHSSQGQTSFKNQQNSGKSNGKQVEPPIPAPGLKNLGNTCYYNSILQALYHTDDFLATMFGCDGDPEIKKMNVEFYKGLQKLFKKMLTCGKDHVNPSSSYKQLPSQFKNKHQHDTTEVARYILDELGCDKLSMWKGLFAGLVIQRIKCKCGYVSDTHQTIIDFSFALAALNDYEESSIQNLMDGFLKKEKLTGDNKYFCNKCNRNRKAEKWNVIASPPIHLMVILNRNLWEIGSDGRGTPEKILRHVHINHTLTVCGFTYCLYGSIIHQGYSTDSGHYYFVGTRSDSVRYPEKWYKMDDTIASRVGPEYIEDTSSDQSNTHVPYVLFYRCNQAHRSNSIYI